MINLLLVNNCYPVIPVQKESDELLYTVWSLVTVFNRIFSPKIVIFSQFQVYLSKTKSVRYNKYIDIDIINLLLVK